MDGFLSGLRSWYPLRSRLQPVSARSDLSAMDQAQEIARRARELGPRDRAEYLRVACGADQTLRSQVLEVLGDDAFDDGNDEPLGSFDETTPPRDRSGERIGIYRLVSRIGLGGMGEVYLASRDDEAFEQRVAIKLVHEGLYGTLTRGRLRTERQMLARLEHPNIARVLDGGTTAEGTPYFVMEYIDGTPIDVYCDRERLDVRTRLQLFRSVCAAVQCAHQNLIVHRDLKPSNILVNMDGQPKLLDFGIAKLLDTARVNHTVAVTHASVRLMTPNYASPEQVRGTPITTASDIYALGLLLHELLTGRRAFDFPSLRLADIERILTTAVPQAPSSVVRGRGTHPYAVDATVLAEARGTSPAKLERLLKGDLDIIVMKALQVEPQRRYASVEQFSRDIENYLAGRPIIAQRDTWIYRSRKFVARYKAPVAVAAGGIVLLIGFAGAMYVQAQRIARERDRATLQEARAATVASFLEELFELSDPGRNRGATITAREILETGARRVAEGLRDQPDTQATLLATIGRVYGNLGLYRNSTEAAQRVFELRRQLHHQDHPEIVTALAQLGEALLEEGDYRNAEPRLQEALAMQQRLGDGASEAQANIIHVLGRVRQLEGRYEEAERLYRESLALYASSAGRDIPQVSSVLNELAQMLERRSDLEGAIAMTREALALDRRLLGDDHPGVGRQLHNLALYLYEQGNLEEAGTLFDQSLSLLSRVLGEAHPDTVRVQGTYGRYLQRAGRYSEAEAMLRDALVRQVQMHGDNDYEVAYSRVNLALLLEERQQYVDAERELRAAMSVYETSLPDDHQYVASALVGLGRTLAVTGRSLEAKPLLERAHAIRSAQLPAKHPQLAVTKAALGRVNRDLGLANAARTLLEESYPILLDFYGSAHVDTQRAAQWLEELKADQASLTVNREP